jgi:hypothetical protein
VRAHGFQKSLNDCFRCHLIPNIYSINKKGYQEPFAGASRADAPYLPYFR